MSIGWENYDSAPIEVFHDEAIKEFHAGAEYKSNEVKVDGCRYINAIEFNRILARFKVKIMKEYGITNEAIPKKVNLTTTNQRINNNKQKE